MTQSFGPVESELIVRDIDGLRAAYLLPIVPDDAPEQIREGLVRRRLAVLTDACPCGGKSSPQNRAARRRLAKTRRGQVAYLAFEHEPTCPAGDDVLVDAIKAWTA